jgi:hypothetical protein
MAGSTAIRLSKFIVAVYSVDFPFAKFRLSAQRQRSPAAAHDCSGGRLVKAPGTGSQHLQQRVKALGFMLQPQTP